MCIAANTDRKTSQGKDVIQVRRWCDHHRSWDWAAANAIRVSPCTLNPSNVTLERSKIKEFHNSCFSITVGQNEIPRKSCLFQRVIKIVVRKKYVFICKKNHHFRRNSTNLISGPWGWVKRVLQIDFVGHYEGWFRTHSLRNKKHNQFTKPNKKPLWGFLVPKIFQTWIRETTILYYT